MTDYELEFNIQRTDLVRCPFTNLYALCNSGTNWDKSWMAWIQNLKTRNHPSVVGPGRILIKSSKTISFPNKVPSQPYEFYFKISIVIHHCCIIEVKNIYIPICIIWSYWTGYFDIIIIQSYFQSSHASCILGDRFVFQRMNKTIS